MSNSERVQKAIVPAMGGIETRMDEQRVEAMVRALAPLTTDDFTCGMIAMDVEQEFEGAEGLKAAWRDWREAYSELRVRIHEFRDVGQNVLMLVDQVGTTRHGGVEVEQPSAAVWKFRDGDLYRVEFHIDRRAAERSAGGQPQQ